MSVFWNSTGEYAGLVPAAALAHPQRTCQCLQRRVGAALSPLTPGSGSSSAPLSRPSRAATTSASSSSARPLTKSGRRVLTVSRNFHALTPVTQTTLSGTKAAPKPIDPARAALNLNDHMTVSAGRQGHGRPAGCRIAGDKILTSPAIPGRHLVAREGDPACDCGYPRHCVRPRD